MVVLFPFQNHPHPSPSGEGLDSAKWALPIALARDRLRAKGRARYGKLVGSSWRAAADPLRLFAGTDYEGAQQNRPARGGRCARTTLRRGPKPIRKSVGEGKREDDRLSIRVGGN